ncbi:NAD-dependent DNA ligase [Prochlorococcus marinus]|uniref:NAD-dependent DNA ligase n=1 Tax=Prochlorococcus marinus XMU1408 TaxID=2213228 RepID=A0A318R6L8_PROMR|nr:NAD-dependent DNA ligase [Prochlorococcus marinus]MBW3042064.1 NAD-dependent DNA ligase [Prochlorococcus marinus str. XMU1408]PYE03182.1 NAD-dependent DNA ligase [Prochlorococcus marinus XMU1408]
MNKNKGKFDHLIKNLERISSQNSIFNYKSGQRAFLSLGKGNLREWLDKLLPNTRLILEPKIIGLSIGIQYIDGYINKAINKRSEDITEKVMTLESVPKNIAIKKRLELRGVLYEPENSSNKNKKMGNKWLHQSLAMKKALNFCAFQIFHCNINHFQALQELKNLNFEVPHTQFTNYISDIEIFRQCWKDGKIFKSYPTNGIVLKINSRKLQKRLGENNLSSHWAYAIN